MGKVNPTLESVVLEVVAVAGLTAQDCPEPMVSEEEVEEEATLVNILLGEEQGDLES